MTIRFKMPTRWDVLKIKNVSAIKNHIIMIFKKSTKYDRFSLSTERFKNIKKQSHFQNI